MTDISEPSQIILMFKELREIFEDPKLYPRKIKKMCGCPMMFPSHLLDMVMHLNDYHKLSFEEIADVIV